MTYVQTTAARNRINPLSVPTTEQPAVPYVTYDEVTLCADPNCPVCRAQRRDKRDKKRHHHRRHHHRKHRTHFWDDILRTESAGSAVSVHSIELADRRTHYNTNVVERDVVPVNQTDRQVVTTTTNTRPNRYVDDGIAREAWVRDNPADDEIVCCRAYNGCRCPCWCCIILLILFVIMIIVLIVLLATLI